MTLLVRITLSIQVGQEPPAGFTCTPSIRTPRTDSGESPSNLTVPCAPVFPCRGSSVSSRRVTFALGKGSGGAQASCGVRPDDSSWWELLGFDPFAEQRDVVDHESRCQVRNRHACHFERLSTIVTQCGHARPSTNEREGDDAAPTTGRCLRMRRLPRAFQRAHPESHTTLVAVPPHRGRRVPTQTETDNVGGSCVGSARCLVTTSTTRSRAAATHTTEQGAKEQNETPCVPPTCQPCMNASRE